MRNLNSSRIDGSPYGTIGPGTKMRIKKLELILYDVQVVRYAAMHYSVNWADKSLA